MLAMNLGFDNLVLHLEMHEKLKIIEAKWAQYVLHMIDTTLLENLSFAINIMQLVVICNYLDHVRNYKFGII
jgi:hypothetical protein